MSGRNFLQTIDFRRSVADLNAAPQVEELMLLLKEHPDYGKLVKGGAGLRKIRMKLPGRGKRGGSRVIYYNVADKRTILLLTVYAKNDLCDLSPHALKNLVTIRNNLVRKLRLDL